MVLILISGRGAASLSRTVFVSLANRSDGGERDRLTPETASVETSTHWSDDACSTGTMVTGTDDSSATD